MIVSVFGMGWVGSTMAVCLAREGHKVLCVESNKTRESELKRGVLPVHNPRLWNEFKKMGEAIEVVDPQTAINDSAITFVCVGTPFDSKHNDIDHHCLSEAAVTIGEALKQSNKFDHVVVIKSTVRPGMTRHYANMIAGISGRNIGDSLSVIFNPEFLREASPVEDFYDPPLVVIGHEADKQAADGVATLYRACSVPPLFMGLEEAEMLKLACNAFHALKVCFANEIGGICERGAIDADSVMKAFAFDTKLNVSRNYLRPGAPFGGDCLPKDVKALTAFARSCNESVPVLDAIMKSNER